MSYGTRMDESSYMLRAAIVVELAAHAYMRMRVGTGMDASWPFVSEKA